MGIFDKLKKTKMTQLKTKLKQMVGMLLLKNVSENIKKKIQNIMEH